MERDVLARLLVPDEEGIDRGIEGIDEALVARARTEGVVALAARRLESVPGVSSSVRAAFNTAARESTMVAMALGAETRRVVAELAEAGLPALLLKGSALACWLYPSPHLRESSDIDLLLGSRADAERAAALCARLGYRIQHAPGSVGYELLCRRQGPGTMPFDLDIHWGLINAPVFAGSMGFAEMQAASIPLPGVPRGRGLCALHALVHACVHRAANNYTGVGERLKWLYDLHLLASGFEEADWRALVELCRGRGLGGVCADALAATRRAFATAYPEWLEAQLLGQSEHALDPGRIGDWKYMQRRNLEALPTAAAKARWAWQQLFPGSQYLRVLYGTDEGPLALWLRRARHLLRRVGS
jgi:hypothetical protein